MTELGTEDDFFCLNEAFSTTRRVTRGCASVSLELTTGDRGGLRLQGYGKSSSAAAPLISVIIPVRNGASTLGQAIESVIRQSYANVELIVIDGQSDDGSVDILKAYDNVIDYWISAPDRGVYDAMNKGVALASGERIYFLGSDDVLMDCFHRIAGSLRDPLAIYHGNVRGSSKSRIIGGPFSARKLIRKNIPHQAIFYPRSVFDQYSYDLRYSVLADYHLNVRCFAGGRYHFVHVPILVALYNDATGLSSTHADSSFAKDEAAFRRAHFSTAVFMEYRMRIAMKQIENRVKKLLGKEPKHKKPRGES